jgi:adenine-specific DNA methylase
MSKDQIAKEAGGHAAGFLVSRTTEVADETLTSINRQPSAPLRQSPVIVHRMVRQDVQHGRPDNG